MKLTLVQQEIVWGNKAHNLATFNAIAEAHYGQTDVLVLPEMFSTGFCVNQPELAETTDGEAIQCVKQWAKQGNYAVVGSVMATDGTRMYNRAFFCQPNGTIDFADKRHLFIGDEQRHFTPGDKQLDVTYNSVKFRVLVCFDLRFPVWSRNKGGEDYDVLVYVANWPKDRIDAWDTLLKARAIENQAYVCGVNAVGTDSYNIQHDGHSVLLNPRGKNLVDFEVSEQAAKTGEVNVEKLHRIRDQFPFLKSGDKFTIEL